jgi:hypothetical protein
VGTVLIAMKPVFRGTGTHHHSVRRNDGYTKRLRVVVIGSDEKDQERRDGNLGDMSKDDMIDS